MTHRETPPPPRSFKEAVYAIVRRVPAGRVTTYGMVALLAGAPRAARAVGAALRSLPPDTDVPWHRVINQAGGVSARAIGDLPADAQRARLRSEGHVFDPEGRINLRQVLWTGDDTPASR